MRMPTVWFEHDLALGSSMLSVLVEIVVSTSCRTKLSAVSRNEGNITARYRSLTFAGLNLLMPGEQWKAGS